MDYISTSIKWIASTLATSACYPYEHSSNFVGVRQYNQMSQADWQRAVQALQTANKKEQTKRMDGNKPIVICDGKPVEAKDMDDAQRKAEAAAHQHSADAFILKPVKRVSPKREVVTTEL